jgi:hypothetical protein
MPSSGMLRRVALVRTHVSEECSSSIIRLTRIGELGITLAVTSNRRTLQRNTMDAIHSFETSVLTRATRLNIPEDGILSNVLLWKMTASGSKSGLSKGLAARLCIKWLNFASMSGLNIEGSRRRPLQRGRGTVWGRESHCLKPIYLCSQVDAKCHI